MIFFLSKMTELITASLYKHKHNSDINDNIDITSNDNNDITSNDNNDITSNIVNDLIQPSICIPCIYENIEITDIVDIFQNKLQFGEIEKVDIIHKNKQINYHLKKIFIHFKKWNHNAEHIRQRLLDGRTIKVVYDDYKFWKCSASRAKYS